MNIYKLKNDIEYSENSIVSKQIYKNKSTITLFALDKNQSISEHSAPFDAAVYIIEGKANFKIGDNEFIAEEDSFFVMPANVPHAISTIEKFKMLLVMLKNE